MLSLQERSSIAKRRFDEGTDCYRRGQYALGYECFSTAIQMQPGWGNAFAWRGVCCERLKRYSEAIEDYTKSIELDPQLAVSYNNRGLVLRTQFSKHKEALEDFKKCLELDPHLVDALNNKAIVHMMMGDLEASKKDVERAFQLMPNYANLFATLSMIHLQANEMELAEAIANKSLSIDKKSPRGYYVLAKVHFHRKEFKEALSMIQIYLQMDHNDSELVASAEEFEKVLKKYNIPWHIARLVWIAWMKNEDNKDCLIPILPKEIVFLIIHNLA